MVLASVPECKEDDRMRKYKVRLLGLGIAVLLGASTPMNVLAEVDSEEIILEESAIKEASAQEEQQEDLKNKADDAENEKVEDQEQKNPEQESSQDTKQESDTFEHEELLKDKEVIKKDEAAEKEQPKDLEERTEEKVKELPQMDDLANTASEQEEKTIMPDDVVQQADVKEVIVGFEGFDIYGNEPYQSYSCKRSEKDQIEPQFPENITAIMEDGTRRTFKAVWVVNANGFYSTNEKVYEFVLELPDYPKKVTYCKDLLGDTAKMPYIQVEITDADKKIEPGDLREIHFKMDNVITNKTVNFDGADGVNSIIIYGGCSSAGMLFQNLKIALKNVDASQLNVYFFDMDCLRDESLERMMRNYKLPDYFYAERYIKKDAYEPLRESCEQCSDGSSSKILVAYKNADGRIYKVAYGVQEVQDLLFALEAGGIRTSYAKSDMALRMEYESCYSYAYKVVELVNEERRKSGLSPLKIDPELMDAAMQRAAETFFLMEAQHYRPNGESCFTVSEYIIGENMAQGGTPENVMARWMSDEHRLNILNKDAASIGVGCVKIGNICGWVQEFGDMEADSYEKKADQKEEYTIDTQKKYASIQLDPAVVQVGESKKMQAYVKTAMYPKTRFSVLPESFVWSSDSDAVSVEQDGTITGVKAGEAVITAENAANKEMKVTCKVTVKETSVPTVEAPEINKIVNTVSGVHVYWNAVPNAKKYALYVSESLYGTYQRIVTTTALHYTDTAVHSGRKYYYKVSALTDNEESPQSQTGMNIFVDTPDLTLRVNRSSGIGLGWNHIAGATGYAIYRKSYDGSDAWVRVATITDGSTMSWVDASAKPKNGTIFRYTVRALAGSDHKTLSGCRNTGRTMVRLFTPTISSAAKASATSMKVAWNRNAQASGYEVRLMVKGSVYKTYTVGGSENLAKMITGLTKGTTYKVQVRSYKKVTGVGSFYSAWSAEKNVTMQ